ncbi:MAG: hypothetical protein ABSA21_01875 [Candidatus Limnocylindrales bacterium]
MNDRTTQPVRDQQAVARQFKDRLRGLDPYIPAAPSFEQIEGAAEARRGDSARPAKVRLRPGAGVPVAFVGVAVVAVLVLSSGVWRQKPGPAASVRSSPTATERSVPAASALPSPSPMPTPTPPAADEPWGGLVWSEPVEAVTPWGQPPDQLVSWHGLYVGLGVVATWPASVTGEVVVASSTDLVHWTVLARGADAPFPGGPVGNLLVGPAGLVAIGPTHGSTTTCADPCPVWTSPDGSTWTRHDQTPFGDSIVDAAAGPDGVVALGSKGWQKPLMWYSATGSTWQPADMTGPQFKAANIEGVYAVPGGFVATGSVGGSLPPANVIGDINSAAAAWWSTDGSTWARAQVGDSQLATELSLVHVIPGGLLADGVQAGEWSSTDARSWTAVPASDIRSRGEIFWSDASHAVVVRYGSPDLGHGADQFWGSVDGAAWRQLTMSGYPAPDEWYYVFVTSDGLIALAELEVSQQVVVLQAAATP